MSDKFFKDKLERDNIALWRRYLNQEGLIEDSDTSLDFQSMLDQGDMPKVQNKEDTVPIAPITSQHNINVISSNEVDRRTDQKLRQGKVVIDSRLDLHGYSRYDARIKFIDFIKCSHQKRARTLLVITGKGRPLTATDNIIEPEQGILKQSLPQWVNEAEIKPLILKYYPAQRKDGGSGAFYIYLRKKK